MSINLDISLENDNYFHEFTVKIPYDSFYDFISSNYDSLEELQHDFIIAVSYHFREGDEISQDFLKLTETKFRQKYTKENNSEIRDFYVEDHDDVLEKLTERLWYYIGGQFTVVCDEDDYYIVDDRIYLYNNTKDISDMEIGGLDDWKKHLIAQQANKVLH